MPKSDILKLREGLIIGSACEAGELFQAILDRKSDDELKRIASFYDFLEIQPLANNRFMLANGKCRPKPTKTSGRYNRKIVRLGEELGKPVVATGDVHFLNPEDEIFRHILLATKGFDDADKDMPLYFRTTDEMLRGILLSRRGKSLRGGHHQPQPHRRHVRIICVPCPTICSRPKSKTPWKT